MPDTPVIDVNVRNTNTITISRKEYDELKKALFAIETIGTSISKYGVDDRIALPLLKTLGYVPPKEEDDA